MSTDEVPTLSSPLKLYPKMAPVLPRRKPMEVLVLGMSRTGTVSMYTALNRLGFSAYHMLECQLHSRNGHVNKWNAAYDAKYNGVGRPWKGQDFDLILWDYNAICDVPGIHFVDEMLEAYPDAKVVLTKRDVNKWLDSVKRSFYTVLGWRSWRLMSILDPLLEKTNFRPYTTLLLDCLNLWTNNDWKDQSKLPDGFHRHYAHVRKVVPADKLLEFTFEDGWEPLCKFLDKPIPDEPYPHANAGPTTEELHRYFFKVWMMEFVGKVVLGAGVVAAPVVGYWYWYLQRA